MIEAIFLFTDNVQEVYKMEFQKPFTPNQISECENKTSNVIIPHLSKELWKNTQKRHSGARENMRHLLDRYIKPHH